MANMVTRWLLSVGTGLDDLASGITGGAPDQTISARLGKARDQGSAVGGFLANTLDGVVMTLTGKSDHCATALADYTASVDAEAALEAKEQQKH